MKAFRLSIVLTAVSAVGINAAEEQATPGGRIARFSGDCAAAISYTFDDGLRDQFTLGAPMLNEFGFKGTFFVIPGKIAGTTAEAEQRKNDKRAWGTITWAELQNMNAQGHEIASHAWSHRSLVKVPPDEIESELIQSYDAIKAHTGKPPLTLAFPFNQSTPEIQAVALKTYVACRTYQIGTSAKTTTASLNAWADRLVQEKKWGVLMAHAITNGYAAMTSPEVLREHLKYVNSRGQDIWVDTFANIACYEQERDEARLTLTGKAGSVTCVLSSSLDPQRYNVPLTIVIDAPRATSASAERSGRQLPVHITDNSIRIQAPPSSQPIIIRWE